MATSTINWQPFSPKHKRYIHNAFKNKMSVAEGAIRSGKTIDNCIIAASYLELSPDRIHLASGSTIANAKMNIGDCNGFGLEHLFRGRCRWGKYKDNEALYIQTKTGEKIVIFAGGGKADSFKKILGNSYGLWIATEINQHYDSDDNDSFIKVAFGRQVASLKPMILWDLNPSAPKHPIYLNYIDKYKESFVGGYNYMHFTIKDNLAITERRRLEIESQYDKNSIWYKRDILGQRCTPEGAIYTSYVNNPDEFLLSIQELPSMLYIEVGIDFGGGNNGKGSANTFVAVGYSKMFKDVIILKSVRIEENLDDEQLKYRFVKFCNTIYNRYKKAFTCYYDNAEPVLGRGLANRILKESIKTNVKPCLKMPILQRIRLVNMLMDQHRFWILNNGETESVKEALYNAVWDADKIDTRLDNGTSDIDSLDAMEYCIERHYNDLIRSGKSVIISNREESNKE